MPSLPEPLGAEGRYGEDAPVDEDSYLGFIVPGGQRPSVQRLPVGLVLSSIGESFREDENITVIHILDEEKTYIGAFLDKLLKTYLRNGIPEPI